MKIAVKKYAHLARVKLSGKETSKLDKDLQKILDHFRELEGLDTKGVNPMTGGTEAQNVFRDDKSDTRKHRPTGGADHFPEEKDGYLKVPKVFE